jgi:hypothetical protein
MADCSYETARRVAVFLISPEMANEQWGMFLTQLVNTAVGVMQQEQDVCPSTAVCRWSQFLYYNEMFV